MPESASPAKIDATKGYGARVVLHGANFEDAMEMAQGDQPRRRMRPSSTPSTTRWSSRGRDRGA